MTISPCISICKTDPKTGFCYGCGRTNDEKKTWKDEKTSDEWKKNNLTEIQKRLNGWQLESFKESYQHKVNNGVSSAECVINYHLIVYYKILFKNLCTEYNILYLLNTLQYAVLQVGTVLYCIH